MRLSECPHCSGPLVVTGKTCTTCGLRMEAPFDENPLVTLTRDEQDFLLEFVLSAGNFKALSERLDLTYPTLRSRLDRIIQKLQARQAPQAADHILDAVDQGVLRPEEAVHELRKITKGGLRK